MRWRRAPKIIAAPLSNTPSCGGSWLLRVHESRSARRLKVALRPWGGRDVLFGTYQTDGFHDEMFDGQGQARPEARLLLETIESLAEGQLLQCQRAAERMLLQMGIT